MNLTVAQRAALDHVRARAGGTDAELVAGIREHARVTVNFHPDRLLADGRTVAAALFEEGRYRSQFETGISNGGRTAYPGGDRDRWEERLFGGAYQTVGVAPVDRPKYGGLNILAHPDGACPRFGSCHLRLRADVVDRCTFCFGDSHLCPAHLGTIDAFGPVLGALLDTADETGALLGRAGVDAAAVLREGAVGTTEPGRALDDYVEAQVHGDIDLDRDVEAIVVDPSFRGTASGALLADLADQHGIPLDWHSGFTLALDDVDPVFRGPAIPRFAERIHREFARDGDLLDAALVGRAAASVVTDPDRWADWAGPDETLQHVKQVWHVLVRFGGPA